MLRVRKLSIWELAHRWYDEDPHKTKNPEDMSLVVKDMIRTLANEILSERLISDLYREGEGSVNPQKTNIVEGRVSTYAREFSKCIKHNEFNYDFLSQVFVESQYLKCWCEDYSVPFPNFWLSWLDDDQTVDLGIPGTKLAKDLNSEKSGLRQIHDEKSERHQKAALKRHGPTADLKRDFVIYWCWKSEEAPNLSRAKAAKDFLTEQGEDAVRKAGLKFTNADKTLLLALRQFSNGPEKTWMAGLGEITKKKH